MDSLALILTTNTIIYTYSCISKDYTFIENPPNCVTNVAVCAIVSAVVILVLAIRGCQRHSLANHESWILCCWTNATMCAVLAAAD